LGVVCDKTLNSDQIAKVIKNAIAKRDFFAENIVRLISRNKGEISMQNRAANAIEIVAKEGEKNHLQRMVSPEWEVYANNEIQVRNIN
jgi:hypothetical protein